MGQSKYLIQTHFIFKEFLLFLGTVGIETLLYW